MNEYAEFLKHLGINKDMMLSSMRSRISDCEKPYQIKNCKRFDVCESSRLGGCVGCNVWNYLYDINALKEWCRKQNVDFMSMSKNMQKMLKEDES